MTNTDLVWLAGLLEGEGSFMKGPPSRPNAPLICAQMTDEDVVERVAALFGTKMVRNRRDKRGEPGKWKPTFSARVRGKRAVSMMKELQPFMGLRRKAQISAALGSFKDKSRTILTSKMAARIRKRALKGIRMGQLAKEFGVSYCTIKKIKYGETWKSAV